MSEWEAPGPSISRPGLLTDTQFAIVVGLVLGASTAFGGFWHLLIVAAFGAAGYVIAKLIDGSIDISGLTGRVSAKR